jgi:hypothetical protein
MSAWTCLRQGRLKDRSTSSSNPMMEGPCADSGEKHEPASDVDAAAVDSLKALDPSRPIREADINRVTRSSLLVCLNSIAPIPLR